MRCVCGDGWAHLSAEVDVAGGIDDVDEVGDLRSGRIGDLEAQGHTGGLDGNAALKDGSVRINSRVRETARTASSSLRAWVKRSLVLMPALRTRQSARVLLPWST